MKKVESKHFGGPNRGDRGTKRIDIDQDELRNEEVNEVEREVLDPVHIFGRGQFAQREVVES